MIKVERMRMALNMDAVATYHSFIHRLPEAFRAELELVRKTRKASGYSFGWKHMVKLARDLVLGATLVKPAASQAAVAGSN